MIKYKWALAAFLCFSTLIGKANEKSLGKISGYVFNEINKEPIANLSVKVANTNLGATTNKQGFFEILEIEPGLYNLELSHVAFIPQIEYNIRVTGVKPVYLEMYMTAYVNSLDQAVVTDDNQKPVVLETNISHKELGHDEMQRLPGANLDLSRAIQAYPGMLPQASFGYSLSTRGGAPSENGYFLDGIKIPAINHFSVQGASGGPNGLINLDFVRKVDLNTGVFPAEYGNVLSNVVDIKQRNGRTDRFGLRLTLGATDAGATMEGPLGSKGNFIASTRYSFSQYMLKAFNVPVLPTYGDAQFRALWKFDAKNELVLTGIGGKDVYRLNMDAEESDALLYNVGYIPEGDQQLYAFGANYKHYLEHTYYNVIVSTNGFNNQADKFLGNTGLEEDRTLRYYSNEQELHFRLEQHVFKNKYEFSYGVNTFTSRNANDVYSINVRPTYIDTNNFNWNVGLLNYGAFARLERTYMSGKLDVSVGFRLDGNNYNSNMSNPLSQFSPRTSVTYRVTDKFGLNANVGRYFQKPQAIILAYSLNETADELTYIDCQQASFGMEYNGGSYRFSMEGYYKNYRNYPFLLKDSLAAANAMANYVVVGNQPANSTAVGRAYGLEMFVQQKLKKNYWWMLAYTYSVSEFEHNGSYTPSSWDSRHFTSFILGKTLKKGWQLGTKFRYSSGTPYTPYNVDASSLISNWDVAQRGLQDFTMVNAERLPAFHSLDFRIDKRYDFEKSNLNIFLDFQNLYESNIQLQPYLALVRDENLQPQLQADDATRYQVEEIKSDTGRRLYALGIVWEF
ncbi:MAG: TonB-dependent receptor [Bacteroidetes bacterium]|nr:TonB-dependent receptor [Bacteroidota bacterium]